MFCVSESEAATIRTAFEQEGELSAGIELRRLFPGITDGVKAWDIARVNRLKAGVSSNAGLRSR